MDAAAPSVRGEARLRRDLRGTHFIAQRIEALIWLAQISVLTIHMWASRAQALEQPDWVVFDLDPAKGKGIEQAIDAAIVMRKLLEELEEVYTASDDEARAGLRRRPSRREADAGAPADEHDAAALESFGRHGVP